MSLNFFKYYGAKHYMLKHILDRVPAHSRYVEVFGGSGKVLLNKEVAPFEVYNDTNSRIYNLFYWLRHDFDSFQRMAALTLYHESNLDTSQKTKYDSLEDAVSTYACFHQSFGGAGKNFSISVNRLRRNVPETVSSWLNKVDGLSLVYQRLSQVQFLCRDFSFILNKFDDADTFFYCDPPYILSTRNAVAKYESEMDDGQHEELVSMLLNLKGKCLLSGYDCPTYSKLVSDGWTREDFPIDSPTRKTKKIESLWKNY